MMVVIVTMGVVKGTEGRVLVEERLSRNEDWRQNTERISAYAIGRETKTMMDAEKRRCQQNAVII